MIEIFRKGFRLDIKPGQVTTFKKSQNLNGIQSRYAYSNTIQLEKTSNNKKLLELFDLPTSKVSSLMNGYEVDVVLNGSINLRRQTLKIQKETKDKIECYLLYSDNTLIIKLKETYLNSVTSSFLYKKNITDLTFKSAVVETQPKSGLYVIEEMPFLINLQQVINKLFSDNNYIPYGDFFAPNSVFSEYFITANKGTYQIYAFPSDGFSPTFDPLLDNFTFLNYVLAYFNCYVEVDDTNRTVVVNRWTNLSNYKNNFIDYSKYYVDYQDYSFQSKLSKRNELKYSDSGTTYDSFFNNNLSSEVKSTYLNSNLGTGALNIFDDSKIDANGNIPLRPNGFEGETSSVKIFKKSNTLVNTPVYVSGSLFNINVLRAIPVSMQTVYRDFHKDYTDFILSPLVSNLTFRYDAIMAADFSLTKVFFIEQLSSYWIPLEINFSTNKDKIIVKSMMVKKRKVETPILNNFNSILLDFKEKSIFPLTSLLSMYPIPPNSYAWDVIVFESYDQDKNKLFINDVLVPASSLPQAFNIIDIVTIKFEANKSSDTQPDTNSDSFYIYAIDTNGGVSNTAYIHVKHTGIAILESNYRQESEYFYTRSGFDFGIIRLSPNIYYQGLRPNLNNTINHNNILDTSNEPSDSFNLIEATQFYNKIDVNIKPFTLRMDSDNNGGGRASAVCKVIVSVNSTLHVLTERSVRNNDNITFNIPSLSISLLSIPNGAKIKVYLDFVFDNKRASNIGSMDISLWVNDFAVDFTTIITA